MADGGIGEVALIATLASTAYSVYQTSQAKAPSMPKPLPTPQLPDTKPLAASQQIADQQARSAGGTVLSEKKKTGSNGVPQIGDGANAVRKTLLGS